MIQFLKQNKKTKFKMSENKSKMLENEKNRRKILFPKPKKIDSNEIKSIDDFKREENNNFEQKPCSSPKRKSENLEESKSWPIDQNIEIPIKLEQWCRTWDKEMEYKHLTKVMLESFFPQVELGICSTNSSYEEDCENLKKGKDIDMSIWEVKVKSPTFFFMDGLAKVSFPEKKEGMKTTLFEIYDKIKELMETPVPVEILEDQEKQELFKVSYEDERKYMQEKGIPIQWKFVIGNFFIESIGSYDPKMKAYHLIIST
jgi:hypothetical protein